MASGEMTVEGLEGDRSVGVERDASKPSDLESLLEREQSRLFVVLAVPSTDVLTTFSLRLVDYHYTQAANAVVLIIAALAFFGTLLGQKLTRSNLAQGLGG